MRPSSRYVQMILKTRAMVLSTEAFQGIIYASEWLAIRTILYSLWRDLVKHQKRRTLEAFGKHITEGSTLIYDKEKAHEILVSQLSLSSIAYDSKDLKGLDDDANPLDSVNELCRMLKLFLRAHSGFIRDDLQWYLNLFHVIMNPPENKYEKVKKILELGLEKSVLLRYRDQKT